MDYKTCERLRRRNLARLIDENGGRRQLAEETGYDPDFLTQLKSEKTKRTFTHDVARSIEQSAKKPKGWLDQDHEALSKGVDMVLLADCIAKCVAGYDLMNNRDYDRLAEDVVTRYLTFLKLDD